MLHPLAARLPSTATLSVCAHAASKERMPNPRLILVAWHPFAQVGNKRYRRDPLRGSRLPAIGGHSPPRSPESHDVGESSNDALKSFDVVSRDPDLRNSNAQSNKTLVYLQPSDLCSLLLVMLPPNAKEVIAERFATQAACPTPDASAACRTQSERRHKKVSALAET